MWGAWLSPSRDQSWRENTSKSSASNVSRFARSSAVRFTGIGGLPTPPSAGSGIGVQPMGGLSPPAAMARVRPDCTAPRARTPSATLWPDVSRERSSMITVPSFRKGLSMKVTRRSDRAAGSGALPRCRDADPCGRPPWLGVDSEGAQHAAVFSQRELEHGVRVVEGEYVGCGQLAEILLGHRG